MQNTTPISPQPNSQTSQNSRPIKRYNKKIAIGILMFGLIVAVLFNFKGLLVAATVDGSPISRLRVVQQLEKQGGKSALDSLITEKLIESEANKKGVAISEDEVSQEMKNIEANIAQQGGTLKDALLQGGLTEENLKDQIRTQKKVEKLLGDRIQVTDADVDTYVLDNKVPLPEGKEAETKKQVADQLRDQKLSQEVPQWIAMLKTQAKIKYYVNY